MKRLAPAGSLSIGLTMLSLLVGCGGSATPTPTATPTPAAPTPSAAPSITFATPSPTGASTAPTATPAVTPNPTPITYGPVTLVSGVENCGEINPVWTIDPDNTAHVRDKTLHCTDTTNDPRVSGAHTANWSMDIWGDVRTFNGVAGVQWGTVRLENDGGTWEGRFTGVASLPQPGDTITIWYEGTGDYVGLAYFELITGVCCIYEIHGQIFPGTYPTP